MWFPRAMSGLTAAVALVASSVLAAPPTQSPRNASYAIDARLDVAHRLLAGTEIVTWRNITGHATSELRFHLYFNAWRNADSSYLHAHLRNRLGADLDEYGPEDWGYCDVRSVRLLPPADGEPIALPQAFVQPDDGNKDDRTVLQVPLPKPVAPGETVRVQVDWSLKVPRPFARAGVFGQFYMMGQWFPKVGVLDADGTWNCHQFIQTEFFADYGTYDVAVTVPHGWIVGATGTPVASAAAADGTETHRYHADDVHDFAWTTSPLFSVHRDRFQSPGLPPVDIELLLMPDHASLRDGYLSSTKTALRLYGTWLWPYPYSRITVVDPPSKSETGGMEYPMLVTGESRWPSLAGNRLAEANTIHEVGHQWWYGLVANNEFEDAWLDEGLNTYTHKRILRLEYGPTTYEKRYFHDSLPVRFRGIHTAQPTEGSDAYDGFRSPVKREPLSTPAFRGDERIYYLNAYGTGSRLAVTLERRLGWERWRQVLATYAERFWFKHPRPADFFAVVNEVSGEDLTWFFDQFYTTGNLFDYAVDRVVSKRVQTPRGYALAGDPPAWGPGGDGPGTGPAASGGPVFESTVDIRRWGEAVFPVGVRVGFEDGSVVDETWDGKARWTRLQYVRPSAVAQVEVDPDQILVLDVNSTNNSWTRHPQASAAATKWTAKWAIWVQSVLELAAFFS
jgi:Peptidase family M1 domain